ncbi:hypothetical protein [Azospirillum sp. SYSU D00513]|uniref:hypothetical protein n=1 Tax=Azospirillum sp. SYSU D00513 TaxID=2812561 RepID=UPI001A958DEF|nr:hypothetical protein [Azospirillum sp. SYSU D00513]
MPLRPHLMAEIQSALSLAITPNLTAASDGADLYEAYVWALVLEAAQSEGGNITFKDINGNTIDGVAHAQFHFRTSPGAISSDRHPYSHAEIHFQKCPLLEAHVGIYIAGKSQVRHECDVAVLFSDEAEFCRQQKTHPRCSKVVLAAECKYYIDSDLGINLGRSFLGLIQDIQKKNRFFVSTKDGESVKKLFARHEKRYELGMSPLTTNIERRLLSNFEQAFRDYRATYT